MFKKNINSFKNLYNQYCFERLAAFFFLSKPTVKPVFKSYLVTQQRLCFPTCWGNLHVYVEEWHQQILQYKIECGVAMTSVRPPLS